MKQIPLGRACGGVNKGVEALVSTVHLGREGDRVWVSCHQICRTSTQPITSTRIASRGALQDEAHRSHQIPQQGIKSLSPLSFMVLSGPSMGTAIPVARYVSGTT